MTSGRLVERYGRRLMRMQSIRSRIRNSYLIIIALMLIPIFANIGFSIAHTQQYNQIITNVSSVGNLSKIIQERIPDEMFNIVAGNIPFESGAQYAILRDIKHQLERLPSLAPGAANSKQLVVANRAVSRLESYIDELGDQIHAGRMVEEWEDTLEEIRGVADLITDLLQEYILQEIEVASLMNSAIISSWRLTIMLEVLIAALACLFAAATQRAVTRSISQPIYSLERLAGRIAQGDLAARAESANVQELKKLTASLNVMAEKLGMLMEESIREQENLKKSEMRTLQAQITPHFIYNTLDAIMWLAQSSRNDEVIHITKAMSTFFRITLSGGRDWISVSQEIEHVESYLMVQHVRYRDILTYSFEIDERLNDQLMLKLVLQPLVENAIYHGIKLIRRPGTIMIRGRLDEHRMHFSVSDSGIGMTKEKLEAIRAQLGGATPRSDAEGYGLYNVDKRLCLYYDVSAGLSIESEYEKGTTVSFSVPIRSDIANV